ncbi:MAG: hypothetical protein JRI68_12425 [Deltaproteobacteria bacterium]|nr:hypothetical protein [Deltaproteobacteria bacterium]
MRAVFLAFDFLDGSWDRNPPVFFLGRFRVLALAFDFLGRLAFVLALLVRLALAFVLALLVRLALALALARGLGLAVFFDLALDLTAGAWT